MKQRCSLFAGLCLALLMGIFPVRAQEATPDARTPALGNYQVLDLPTPNDYRSASGMPGEDYWQQQADYDIRVTLDPATHRISGTETITYTNNSPDPLEYLWLQMDQNLFAPGSRGATMQPPTSRWRGSFADGGYQITRVALIRDGRRAEAAYLIDDTRMRIHLDEPMAPEGSEIQIQVDFSFKIPEYGADRMGRLEVEQGTVYEVAQWYPRMYVYDDVHGWNPLPYLGQGEFYLEFGTFDVAITAPRDFVVVATGELTNPEEVFTEAQAARYAQARRSAETVTIIGRDEVGTPAARPAGREMLTWKYHAEDVRDFAWAASEAFILDGASWEDVLLLSAYPKEGIGTAGNSGWEESTQYLRHTISHYSDLWFRYPYPVAINVAGIVGGMEYPMIVFCSVRARDQGLFGVTDHEFGHSWFPMIVGSDERRYAWMDEGFNTFINYYSNLAFYGEDASRGARVASERIAERMEEAIADQPIATYPDRIRREGLGFLAYRKPAKGLIILREYILGPERFDPAFREYIQRWAFKHPQPADFFRTMEGIAGEDLDWFWRGWFFSTDRLDQSIADVAVQDNRTIVRLDNLEGLVMPMELEATFQDGRTARFRVPVEAFTTSDSFTTVIPGGDVVRLRLDPDNLLPDVEPRNNVWMSPEAAPRVGQPRGE